TESPCGNTLHRGGSPSPRFGGEVSRLCVLLAPGRIGGPALDSITAWNQKPAQIFSLLVMLRSARIIKAACLAKRWTAGGPEPSAASGDLSHVKGAIAVQLGMIGLGRMGGNMAERCMRAGHSLVVSDIHAPTVQKYAEKGATGAASVQELV